MKQISYENYYWQNELVRLRALTFEDWEQGYHNYFDSKARFFLQEEVELPPAVTNVQEEYKRFANFNIETGRTVFTIETLNGISVGGLNLNNVNERNGTFSIGIQINVEHRGKGYGTASMRILIRYAFLERRLNKFNSGLLDGNIASAKMHEKLGCVQEGIRRQMFYSDGRYVDWILIGLTKDEFIENERKLSKR